MGNYGIYGSRRIYIIYRTPLNPWCLVHPELSPAAGLHGLSCLGFVAFGAFGVQGFGVLGCGKYSGLGLIYSLRSEGLG